MVDKIKAIMARHPGAVLQNIVFRGHGSNAGFYPGPTSASIDAIDNDVVPGSVDYDPAIANKLAELKPYMSRDAMITIEACFAGKNRNMLQALANLTGASVTASTSGGFLVRNIVGGVTGYSWYTAVPGGGLRGQDP
jgi:hypothetical protein